MILENIEFIRSQDPEIGDAVAKEYARQQRGLELIASSTPKATPENATTAAANASISPRTSPSSAPRSYSAPSTRTFSRTPALRLTPRYISRS